MKYKLNQELKSSYDKESFKFEKDLSLNHEEIEKSKNIFDIDLNNNIAVPKKLEVIALLAGLPFPKSFQNHIGSIQNQIKSILRDKLYYMVKKENLGLELLVLKWPEQDRNLILEKNIIRFLDLLNISEIEIIFDGIQIHTDGCIVLRGFDVNESFLRLRKIILDKFNTIPKKQSNWVHIPIGRILTNLSLADCKSLQNLIYKTREIDNYFPSQNINKIKLIHENQWYMEKKSTIKYWKLKK